jgi:hypothetical protein
MAGLAYGSIELRSMMTAILRPKNIECQSWDGALEAQRDGWFGIRKHRPTANDDGKSESKITSAHHGVALCKHKGMGGPAYGSIELPPMMIAILRPGTRMRSVSGNDASRLRLVNGAPTMGWCVGSRRGNGGLFFRMSGAIVTTVHRILSNICVLQQRALPGRQSNVCGLQMKMK